MTALGAGRDPGEQVGSEEMQHLGDAVVAAINDRDPEALAAIVSPQAEFRPRVLSVSRTSYRGHEGLRDYFRDLRARDRGQRLQVREMRVTGPAEFVILGDLVADDELLSPAALVLQLQDGLVFRASGYLSDEDTMISVGLIPARD